MIKKCFLSIIVLFIDGNFVVVFFFFYMVKKFKLVMNFVIFLIEFEIKFGSGL